VLEISVRKTQIKIQQSFSSPIFGLVTGFFKKCKGVVGCFLGVGLLRFYSIKEVALCLYRLLCAVQRIA
jgi:hypothetical protein